MEKRLKTETVAREIRRKTRRKYSAEEKIRRALERLRGEVDDLRKENNQLKQLVAELKLTGNGRVSGVSSKDKVAESYRTVVEDQTEMITRHLPDGTLTFVNRAYSQYCRCTREELIGTKFFPRLTPSNRRIVRKNLSSVNVHNPVVTNVQRILTPDGEERWYHWVNRALFDQRGTIVEFQAVGRDITELKNIEKELKQKEDTLKVQKNALERKNIALHEILEQIEVEKKQIKDDVVHNVETLLLPSLKKIQNQLPRVEPKYLTLLEKNLLNMVSSFGRKISRENLHLTPREIEICNLIRNGFTSKEIAGLLQITFNTVEGHRTQIRKKLLLTGKKINLTSFLSTMD